MKFVLLHFVFRSRYKFKRQRTPSVFFPNSYVPQNLRFFKPSPMVPGPGRYSPELPACPCSAGTSFSAERERLLEIILRHHRPVPPRLHMKPCSSPQMRSILGNGHTYVFRSKVIRLLSIASAKRKPRKGAARHNMLQMTHDAKYIKMILSPNRLPISQLPFDLDALQLKPGKIRFNTIERTTKRTKLRNNKRIAFLSGCPRWSVNAIAQLIADKNAAMRPVHKSPNVHRFAPWRPHLPAEPAAVRLRSLPARYRDNMPEVDHSGKMKYTFEPLPPARILVQDKLTIDKKGLQKVNQPIEPHMFYKPEVSALHNIYLEQLESWNAAKELLRSS